MAIQANDGPMNNHTSSNSAASTNPGAGLSPGPGQPMTTPKPTVFEAKARLLDWGNRADAGRAKMVAGVVSGVMPLVATGAIGIVGGYVANFFTRRRSKATKPDPAAASNGQPPSGTGGLLSIGNLVKAAVWLVPLILRHQASSKQK